MNRLSTKKIIKTYNKINVVNSVDISVKTGEITGLLGRNGAGKTTTFLMLAGIIKPDRGSVFLDDREITSLPSHKRSELGLVYLPQQHSVFMKTSVFDNLYQILEIYYDEEQATETAQALLKDFGLTYLKNSRAYQLSGGEKRRLEIARAMIMKPRFLFLDEPFAGIDPITILEIQKIILSLKQKGIGIIITDHNVADTLGITDKVYILHKGEILSQGSPEKISKEEKTKQLFLGKDFEWHSRVDK